jgi:HPt (histidine-containing phosphotransfer) domain-containing protein
MDDFLAKPVQFHDAEEMLRKHFGARAVGSMASVLPVPASPVAIPAGDMPSGWPAMPACSAIIGPPKPDRRQRVRIRPGETARALDLGLIADTCAALSAVAYGGLLAGFMSDESASLANLLVLLEQPRGAAEDLANAAHRFKGAAASLGLRELAETAGDIENESEAKTLTDETAALAARRLMTQFETARELVSRMGWLGA